MGRIPLRRGPRRRPRADDHAGHRHRRRDRHGRPAAARRARRGGGGGAPAGRPRGGGARRRAAPDGRWWPCGNRGCWEQYASGTALGQTAREVATSSPAAAAQLLERVDGAVERLTGEDVAAAAADGDALALELVTEVGSWLGQGIADLAAVLDPEVVVIGGGVSK